MVGNHPRMLRSSARSQRCLEDATVCEQHFFKGAPKRIRGLEIQDIQLNLQESLGANGF